LESSRFWKTVSEKNERKGWRLMSMMTILLGVVILVIVAAVIIFNSRG
jgi:heme/copper-type cytochrome/quinol oxidase subunit 2